ncbi:hypothetical protein MLD52_09150 [Puniceicoccaceae bacterium K14]|nr:hypothetical protein [Puniceicoccaceae bacterium K14]
MKNLILITLIALSAYSGFGADSIKLSWQDNSDNEDGFIVERSVDGVVFEEYDLVDVNVSEYEDTVISPKTEYWYRIAAYNDIGKSDYTNTVNVVTRPYSDADEVQTVPIAPSNLQIRYGTVFLTQGYDSDGATDYRVFEDREVFQRESGVVSIGFRLDVLDSKMCLYSRDASEFGAGGHNTVWVMEDGSLDVRFQSDEASFEVVSDPGLIVAGSSHWVEVSFGSSGFYAYVDGVQVIANDQPVSWLSNNEPLTIGASQMQSSEGKADNLEDFFRGEIFLFLIEAVE